MLLPKTMSSHLFLPEHPMKIDCAIVITIPDKRPCTAALGAKCTIDHNYHRISEAERSSILQAAGQLFRAVNLG
jgi:hypothetical protein